MRGEKCRWDFFRVILTGDIQLTPLTFHTLVSKMISFKNQVFGKRRNVTLQEKNRELDINITTRGVPTMGREGRVDNSYT